MRACQRLFCLAVVAVVLAPSIRSALAQDTPILAAMADELARSTASLRLAGQPAPYFIEYEIEDRISTRATARLGALLEDLHARVRTLRVGVRVGDYDFDSSLFGAPGAPFQDATMTAPLDEDYDAMRRQIWLATDVAYRRAISLFARKKAAFQNRAAIEVVPDFSREAPVETVLTGLPATRAASDWPERARQVSAAFSQVRGLDSSEVSVADTRGTRYYLNSEGFKVVAPIQIASLRASAEVQASDGMTLRDAFTIVERNLQDLPPVPEIASRAREMAEQLQAQRAAPIGEEYTGPVLLEGQASAEIVMQGLVPAMLARRAPELAGRGGGRGGRAGGGGDVTPFLRRIGLRVLSEPFSVSDTPSLREFEGRPVPGAYTVDDYGIRAKDVTLVEKGRLVTLLAGRAPLRGLLQSSGHTRGGDVQAGVFQLRSADGVPAAELRRKYLQLLETQGMPFGYIVRRLSSPGDAPGAGPGAGPMIAQGVKVSPDGREHVVRGVRLGAVPPATFRDLLDASREQTLYSARSANTNAVSVIVPNLIFEELEIQQTRDILQRPPVVPSPLGD
jgi:hypothetical protein